MERTILSLFVAILALAGFSQKKGEVLEINQEQFAEKIGFVMQHDTSFCFQGKRPAVVDFNAVWCGPCRQLTPILKELAKEFKGKVDFYSVDVDKNKELASTLQIRNIPYLVLFPKNGTPKTITGLYPKDVLKKKINEILLGK